MKRGIDKKDRTAKMLVQCYKMKNCIFATVKIVSSFIISTVSDLWVHLSLLNVSPILHCLPETVLGTWNETVHYIRLEYPWLLKLRHK